MNKDAQNFLSARDLILRHRTDWAAARQAFSWPEIGNFNWARDYFDTIATHNTRTALHILEEDGNETRLSYDALATRSRQVAGWLNSLGIGRNDRILVMLPNIAPLWELTIAAIRLGAVVIPATTLLAGDDLSDRLHRGRVRAVVTTPAETTKFSSIDGTFLRIATSPCPAGWTSYDLSQETAAVSCPVVKTAGNDPLLLYFTSGTTAKPKLVVHTQTSYPAGSLSSLYWMGLMPGDIHWNISSPGWAKHAWSNVFVPLLAEATVFVANLGRFNAKTTLDTLVEKRVTTLCAPPTVWRMLIQEDLKSWPVHLRELLSAGEPLNPEVISQVHQAWGREIRDGYGQTETTALVGNSPGQKIHPGSMGRPMPGYDIALLDANGEPGDEGEIAVRTSPRPVGLMAGYQDGDDLAAHAWYRTGDVATRDEDGYLTYVGRADDVFKASDYRISPFELESVLIEHVGVAEAAVVPSPDPVRLSVPKAFISAAPGHTPGAELARSIYAHLQQRLPPYKTIRRLEFADLPKTISGKIRRVQLRDGEKKARDMAKTRNPMEFLLEDFPEVKLSKS